MENRFVEEAAKLDIPQQGSTETQRLERAIACELLEIAAFWRQAAAVIDGAGGAMGRLREQMALGAQRLVEEAHRVQPDCRAGEDIALADERAVQSEPEQIRDFTAETWELEKRLGGIVVAMGRRLMRWQQKLAHQLPTASRLQEGLATLRTSIEQQRKALMTGWPD